MAWALWANGPPGASSSLHDVPAPSGATARERAGPDESLTETSIGRVASYRTRRSRGVMARGRVGSVLGCHDLFRHELHHPFFPQQRIMRNPDEGDILRVAQH